MNDQLTNKSRHNLSVMSHLATLSCNLVAGLTRTKLHAARYLGNELRNSATRHVIPANVTQESKLRNKVATLTSHLASSISWYGIDTADAARYLINSHNSLYTILNLAIIAMHSHKKF